MRRPTIALTFVVASLLLAATSARLAAQDIVLELPLPTLPKAVAVQVSPAGARIPLTLVKTGSGTAADVKLAVTPFLSEAGERLVPLLTGDSGPPTAVTELTLHARTRQFITATLVVPSLPGPGPFTGSVFVVVDDGAPARQVIAVTAATQSRPATLQVQPEADSRVHTIRVPFWTSAYSPPETFDPDLGPTFDLRANDAGGRWTVTGLSTGPATAIKAPGSFTFADHAAFYDESGARVRLPTLVPTSGRTLRLQLGGLTAGEYNVVVPFLAANAGAEPRKVTLIVYSKHHVAYAVLCLLVALLASFWASKLVSVRSERVRLMDRINEMRPVWLQNEPRNLAVAWIQSIADQARQLAETPLLPSLETIHKRLDTAQGLVRTLDRLRRMRLEIRQSALTRLARARALKVAERLADRLDPEMSQTELGDLNTAIADLRGWTRQGEAETRYSADLSGSIAQLLTEVKPDVITPAHRQAIADLVAELKTPLPTSAAALEERERRYAMLKILWERREAKEFEELVPLVALGIDHVFQKADETAWARLKTQGDRLRVELVSHRNGLIPEAYDPLTFRLTTGDPALDGTFLVLHGLTYEWTFTLTGKKESVPLSSSTHTPYVPLFAPFAGTMTPSVALVRSRDLVAATGRPVTVARSRRFTAVNGFSAGEVLQLVLAFIVAVITGLQTFYFKSASFGSLSDYMALFAWGATIDQVKNFLQRLPSAPSTSAVPAGAGTVAATAASAPAAVVVAPSTAAGAAPVIGDPARPTALQVPKP